MSRRTPSRRSLLKGASAAATSLAFPTCVLSQAPPAEGITPALIEAAKKEGKVNYYTSVDLPVSERMARAFEARFPGIAVKVERSGAERVYSRIAQEYASKIHNCDTLNTSDAAHFIVWKREGLLQPIVSEDLASKVAPSFKDPDGAYATWRVVLSPIAYNSTLVKPDEAPKAYADLLDPRWSGRLVKGHPGYSGATLTTMFQLVRELGWSYFEKLAGQKIMQVQSAADPPKKLALGERAAMVDGVDYVVALEQGKGAPLEIVYPAEGTPLISGPSAVMKRAPHPNAAKLFHMWSFTPEAQELMVSVGALRPVHAGVKDRPGRKALSEIKLMQEDAAGVEKQADELKKRYAQLFKV